MSKRAIQQRGRRSWRGACKLTAIVQIHLCKKSLDRLAGGPASVTSVLRHREHSPVVKDCLSRCERCELGGMIAIADGMPMSAPTFEAFLNDLEALAAEDV